MAMELPWKKTEAVLKAFFAPFWFWIYGYYKVPHFIQAGNGFTIHFFLCTVDSIGGAYIQCILVWQYTQSAEHLLNSMCYTPLVLSCSVFSLDGV
jgi:hypothetical protein